MSGWGREPDDQPRRGALVERSGPARMRNGSRLDGDGLFPDTQDIADFLFVFGGGACPTGTCGDIDFNNDGLFRSTRRRRSVVSGCLVAGPVRRRAAAGRTLRSRLPRLPGRGRLCTTLHGRIHEYQLRCSLPATMATPTAGELIGVVFVVALLARTTTAQPILVDFELLPGMGNTPGATIPAASRLGNQYLATHGVRFSPGSPFVGVVIHGGGTPGGTRIIGGLHRRGSSSPTTSSFRSRRTFLMPRAPSRGSSPLFRCRVDPPSQSRAPKRF